MKACGFNFDTTYTALPKQFFSKLRPNKAVEPSVTILNNTLAESMGLDFSNLTGKEQCELFAGNYLPKGSTPFSQAYAGHQFGHFTLLGDGRAHILGEHITPAGDRFDIQFKGSGRTPYSRSGDGKALLGPMLREYIISEAMYYLGIPTTRSLAVVTTGEQVLRETILPGAILTRVASSHIRVGTFQFAANHGDKNAIEALMDYTIKRHYPELIESHNKALSLIRAVIEKQADLIVHWMRIGFIHGVMNTDNMTLSGETIDYGPCAFMDVYDPKTVFSSIDRMGRYSYSNQPKIAHWNLARLLETLLPLIDDDIDKAINLAEQLVSQFPDIYKQKWLCMMCSKLGLFNSQAGDEQLISDLLDWMQKNHANYINTFLDLTQTDYPTGKIYEQESFKEWYLRWHERLKKNSKSFKSSLSLMRNTNPAIIPRNHIVESVLNEANSGNFKSLRDLLEVLKEPYKDRELLKPYQSLPKPSDQVYQTFCGT
jgi:serine/tyrosine/threonine adenylyltransferase